MMRSLFSGVSGLRNHQVRMDVIGNNVSNVNTVAFKAGRVTFKEGFAQLLQGASRPPGDQGGINPIQIGLGMQIGSIDTLFSQGNLEKTAAKPTDSLKLGGNLDASSPIFTGTFDATGRADAANSKSWTETSISVFDSLGNQHDLQVFFWKTAANEWSWQVDGTNLPAGFTPTNATAQALVFDTDGTL